jgi:hypothetical protein
MFLKLNMQTPQASAAALEKDRQNYEKEEHKEDAVLRRLHRTVLPLSFVRPRAVCEQLYEVTLSPLGIVVQSRA